MVSIAKIAPPNRDAYGTDYPTYLAHYKIFRNYVISLRSVNKTSKDSHKGSYKSALTSASAPVKVVVPPLTSVGGGITQTKATKPARKVAEPGKNAAAKRQLASLELLEKKAAAISRIVSLNKTIADADGWTPVKPKRSRKVANITSKSKIAPSSNNDKEIVSAPKAKKLMFQVVRNPKHVSWSTEHDRLTAATLRGSVQQTYDLKEFLHKRPEPTPFFKVDLTTGVSSPFNPDVH